MNPQPYRFICWADGFLAIPVDGSHLKRKLKEDGKYHAMKKDFIVYG